MIQVYDATTQLTESVNVAIANRSPVNIRGGGSKDFLGVVADAPTIDVSTHQGIISYEPTELVLTARTGTPLEDINNTLKQHGQMLAFEPPCFTQQATIGGSVASALSGPGRLYLGAIRDHVLGCRLINGKGQQLRFGGEVMKNVAGYDVTRLMTGAMGTLGLLLDVSLKVIPIAEQQITLKTETDIQTALLTMQDLAVQSPLVSASMWLDGALYVRLSGVASALGAAATKIGGDETDSTIWAQLKDHTHEYFNNQAPLWRISVPAMAPELDLDGHWLYDWAGTQRFLYSDENAAKIRAVAEQHSGYAQLFRGPAQLKAEAGVNHPPTPAIMALHKKLKQEFDPHGVYNPGRLYGDL